MRKAAGMLKLRDEDILSYKIQRKSLDARKKSNILSVYTVDVQVPREKAVLRRVRDGRVSLAKDVPYQFPEEGREALPHPPVVIGSGPAGLFCAYLLAEHGYCPIILERGRPVEERTEDVERFWRDGRLDPKSNVQFGEGGAGTFSDGKLNTLVKDQNGRNRKVLEIFIRHGAPEEVAYLARPHVGTDALKGILVSMRRQIEAWGGTYRFKTRAAGLQFSNGRLSAIECVSEKTGERVLLEAEAAALAIGHSARDTFRMLLGAGFPMEAKAFAVGLRVEHPQEFINIAQYGEELAPALPAASYKLTASLESGRGAYSFCMCPGGYVVNASSEEGQIAVNGMSYSGRDGENANSAIIVTVSPQDFGSRSALAGMEFQERLEEKAFRLGNGEIPQQLFGDFERGEASVRYGEFPSATKGRHAFGPLHELFPMDIKAAFCEGMHQFAGKIPGFDRRDAILSGVESRTSSPVRIWRDEGLESSKRGVYPCGEGAGYAGGILSAAMDGMKVAEALARRYRRPG